jgi:hypothetical protein
LYVVFAFAGLLADLASFRNSFTLHSAFILPHFYLLPLYGEVARFMAGIEALVASRRRNTLFFSISGLKSAARWRCNSRNAGFMT